MSSPFISTSLAIGPRSTPDIQELAGGAIRVSTSLPSDHRPPPVSTTRATFADQGAEEVRGFGVTKYAVGRDDAAPTSVMQSMRREGGRVTVQLEPGVESSRTWIEVAERHGLVRSAGPGVWVDMQGPAAVALQQAPQGTPQQWPEEASVDPGAGVFDPEADALWAEDIAPLEQAHYDTAVAATTDAIVEGGSLDTVAEQFAAQAGIDPALASAYVTEGASYYADVVATDLERQGITDDTREEFYAYLRAEKAPELKFAIKRLTTARDITVFRRLATEWQMRKAGR